MGGRRPVRVGKGFLAQLRQAQSREQAIALAETFHGRAFVLLSLMVAAALALLAFAVLAAPGVRIDVSKIQDPLHATTFESPSWLTNPALELGLLTVMPLSAATILLACGVLLRLTHRQLVMAKQNLADRLAADIHETLRAGREPQPFVFYLGDDAASDVEAGIDRAASQIGPVVCLGEPLGEIGAGRIKVAVEERQSAIRLLAEGAELIVLGPMLGPDAVGEAKHMLGGDLIRKAVVVGLPGKAVANGALSGSGVSAPEASGKGQLLYFGDARSPRITASFDKPDFGQMFRFFQMVSRDRQRRLTDGETVAAPASV